jgi:two-component system chemotaxis response regulator CheB
LPNGPGLLLEVLRQVSALPVNHGVDGEKIVNSRVYVAPPDFHLMVDGPQVRVLRGRKESRHRPAVDALFRTAAESYGPRVVGVVLTGYLDDGTAGLNAVKNHGGIAVVQDPEDAVARSMPENALRYVDVDHCLPLAKIPPLLTRLAATGSPMKTRKPKPSVIDRSMKPKSMQRKFGPPTPFVCPECNGPLWETESGRCLQFRCHVGHAYSPDSLLADHKDSLERALWSAVRTFDEQAALRRQLAGRKIKPLSLGSNLERRAKADESHAEWIRKLLKSRD